MDTVFLVPGDRVKVGNQLGTLRWTGSVHYAQGVFAGIELDEEKGKNDGAVKGQRYFTCPPRHGIFSKLDVVQLVDAVSQESDERVEEQSTEFKEKGNTFFRSKEYTKALTEYTRALELSPRHPIILGNRSACYLLLGKPEDALRDAQVGCAVDKNLWKLQMRRGNALKELMRFQESAEAFEAALELTGNDPKLAKERKHLAQLREESLALHDQHSTWSDEDSVGYAANEFGEEDPSMEATFQDPEFLMMMQSDPEFQAMLTSDPAMKMMFDQQIANSQAAPGTQSVRPPMPVQEVPSEQPKARFQKPVLRVFDLHEAVQSGELSAVAEAIARDEGGLNQVDDHGLTALGWACKRGMEGAVELLLEKGAQVNPRKAIHGDMQGNRQEAEDDDEEEDDVIALHEAARKGFLGIAKRLVDSGADLHARESILGHTVMHRAVESGSDDVIRYVADLDGSLVNMRSFSKVSPLGLAVSRQDTERVKLLVNLGASADEPSSLSSCLSQLVKVQKKGLEVDEVQALHACLAGAGAVAGVYEVYAAAQAKCDHLLACFRESCGDNPTGADGENVWHICASRRRNSASVEVLLEAGLGQFINEKNNKGETCLHVALRRSDPDMVQSIVVDAKADVNVADADGNTPLHIAGTEMQQTWELLLNHGANQSALNQKGESPVLKENPADKCVIS